MGCQRRTSNGRVFQLEEIYNCLDQLPASYYVQKTVLLLPIYSSSKISKFYSLQKIKIKVENIGKENKCNFVLNDILRISKSQSGMLVTVCLFPLTACKPLTQVKSHSQTPLQTVAEEKACFVGCYHSSCITQKESEGASSFYIVRISWVVNTGLISVFAHQRNGPEAVEFMLA